MSDQQNLPVIAAPSSFLLAPHLSSVMVMVVLLVMVVLMVMVMVVLIVMVSFCSFTLDLKQVSGTENVNSLAILKKREEIWRFNWRDLGSWRFSWRVQMYLTCLRLVIVSSTLVDSFPPKTEIVTDLVTILGSCLIVVLKFKRRGKRRNVWIRFFQYHCPPDEGLTFCACFS